MHNCDDQSSLHTVYVSPQFKYMTFRIFICIITFSGYITNSQRDQLPVGLIAQLVEHCTGIAEVVGSNPVEARMFFQALISQLLKLKLCTV